jgi:hypothetical protein
VRCLSLLIFLPADIPSAENRSDRTREKNLSYQSGVPVSFAYEALFSVNEKGSVL